MFWNIVLVLVYIKKTFNIGQCLIWLGGFLRAKASLEPGLSEDLCDCQSVCLEQIASSRISRQPPLNPSFIFAGIIEPKKCCYLNRRWRLPNHRWQLLIRGVVYQKLNFYNKGPKLKLFCALSARANYNSLNEKETSCI